jgi:hypothetical protein
VPAAVGVVRASDALAAQRGIPARRAVALDRAQPVGRDAAASAALFTASTRFRACGHFDEVVPSGPRVAAVNQLLDRSLEMLDGADIPDPL